MASIKDVAREAGVSIGTVDRIIHQRGRFSEETAQRVRLAMESLDYQPNFHARGLRNQSTSVFYALLPGPEQDNGYWELVLQGVNRAVDYLASYGCAVHTLHFDRYRKGHLGEQIDKLKAGDCRGLLIAPVGEGVEEDLLRLKEKKIPAVFIDTDIPEYKEQRLAYLGEDSRQSGMLAGKMLSLLLAGRDNRDIWIVLPPGGGSHLSQRMEGFLAYLKESSLEWNYRLLEEASDLQSDFHRMLDRAEQQDGGLPGGIFVVNALVYHAASWLKAGAAEKKSIALVGYDFIPGKQHFIEEQIIDFILTTQPETQGYEGLLMLYRHLVLKKEISGTWQTPINLVTKENLNCIKFCVHREK